jgi:hypothetical protein
MWANFQRNIELFTPKKCHEGLGSGILDPGSGNKPIPDPGSRIPDPGVKKAPDSGSRIQIRNTAGYGGGGLSYLWQRSHRLAPQFLHPLQPHLGIAQRLCRALVVHVEHVVGQTDDLVAKLLVQRERVAS